MRKSCRGTIITLRTEVYLTAKEDNPALVLSNLHNRILAGSLKMNTALEYSTRVVQ
jgi:hypothetical protein